jgi:DNA-binding response OmpR family regulator
MSVPSVLIVDDSLTVRMDLAEAFSEAGFETVLCGTVAEARSSLLGNEVGLVVLDVLLPDADGIEFLRELRGNPAQKALPVLVLSTEAEVKDRIRGLQTGADEFVGKPYDRSYVVARGRRLLRGPGETGESRKMVLVIDDSTTYRERLRGALSEAGYDVLTAASGEEGLRLAALRRPGAVLVDGVLPGIDGATVVRRIRLDAALRRTPCLLLTASEEAGAELRALDAGADAFVRKDDEMSLVLARLGRVVRSPAPDEGTTSLLAPKRILCVDDSVTYLEELAGVLREEGYDVVQARSGEEALELLSVQPVDCILLDVVMPGMSGPATCQRIKDAPTIRDIPLILLTSLEKREAMIEGLATGADDYISKSSEFEVLKARVSAQIRRKQFEDETRRMRAELFHREIEATEARAAREIAESRAVLVAALERKNRELEEASRVKSEFLANMSHELRTPLNAIIGFAELMHDEKMGSVSALHKEALEDILTSSRHLLQLINDILDLSKVEAGKMEFRPEKVDLAKVVSEVTDILRSLSARKHIAIAVAIEPGLDAVTLDPGKLKQVLYNYLSNALKFTPEEGKVSVRASSEDREHFRVEVEDTGIGIGEEDLPKLFAEFQQLDTGVGKSYGGTGLGLALTKRIVEAQGGTVGLRSAVGRGSTFFAVLPKSPRVGRDRPR